MAFAFVSIRNIVAVMAAAVMAVPSVLAQSASPQLRASGGSRPASHVTKPGVAAAKSGAATAAKFGSAEEISRFIGGYRAMPEPRRVVELFRAMAGLGLLSDTESSGLYLGFIGGMLAADPAKAAATVTQMFPLPPEYQAPLVKAIAYSGLPEWKDLLKQFAERMPARVVLIDRFVTGRMAAFEDMQLDAGPVPLDVMWGHYFATGSYEPIVRIVSILKWSMEANDVEKLTVGSMAKWTLASNASTDAELLRLLKSTVGAEGKVNQRLLTDVIAAAETGEISAIRKGALAAIDQLKTKGPANTRTAAWWGQAGQMALSLGCVAASALGATAAIGIPCVIGGAASTAALKMMTPQ